MKEFERQYQELLEFLKFKDYNLVIKRIIDFTLDTENNVFYQKTSDFLDWHDQNEKKIEEKEQRLHDILNELYSYLNQKSSIDTEKMISCVDIEKSYGNSRFGLGPINLEIKSGEIIGLVGENGNGKTTLLRCLCGELFLTKGKIDYHFEYEDLYDLRTKLVYIPQRTENWYGSMYENLQFTASEYGYNPNENKLIVDLIITRLGLRKFKNHSWKDLSSGYKMRFELARMLLRKPKILLIDEPLANLDILAQQTILEDFRAIAKSVFRPIGIVLSSQQLYEVEKTSDQVVFLKDGKQRNLHNNAAKNDVEQVSHDFVIEFETKWTQSSLTKVLQEYNLISLEYNGNTFIASFNNGFTVSDFLKIAIEHSIELNYFRNISNSTRRFFTS